MFHIFGHLKRSNRRNELVNIPTVFGRWAEPEKHVVPF